MNNTEMRCLNCFNIYQIKINPSYPTSTIIKTCKCSSTTINISYFLTEYKKNKKFTISCSKCNKQNPKDSIYCEDCKKLYCSNCLKSTHQMEEFKSHKYIPIDKYDYFCILHQNENFNAYCKTCKLDICSKCVQNKLHEKHKITFFNKRYDEKKMKEYLKKALKSAEAKIEYNKVICNMICKKINKNESKSLKNLNSINETENKYILEILDIFHKIYDDNKIKNNALISNLIDNIDFNLEKIKFEKSTSKEKDMEALTNYFKTDSILKVKTKKEEIKTKENQEKDNNINQNEQIQQNKKDLNEENKEEKKEEEKLTEVKKEEIENKEVKKKDENKIEEGKKEEEKKEEVKEGEEKKEEEEKEEENKIEDEVKEKENNEEANQPKSIKQIQAMLNNKINLQGGFRQSAQPSSSTNKNNGIINEPKGNPENIVNIIQNQTIIKKTKKKPRKINFES